MTLLTTRTGNEVTYRSVDLSVIDQLELEPLEPKGWKEGSQFRQRDEALVRFHQQFEVKGQEQ